MLRKFCTSIRFCVVPHSDRLSSRMYLDSSIKLPERLVEVIDMDNNVIVLREPRISHHVT